MPNKPNILILTAQTGGGHLSLAEALKELLQQNYAVAIADMLPSFFHHQYRFAGHHALWMWAVEFHFSNDHKRAVLSQRALAPVIASRLKRALDEIQPAMVITTHSLLSHSANQVMREHMPDIPLGMLFSDPYSVHETWFSELNAEASFAPTRESHELALAAGFDPSRLHIVGWPVRKQFYQADGKKRDEVLRSIELEPDRFTVFLQGGGDGATNYWRFAERLLEVNRDVQIILSAGTNVGLVRRLRGIKRLHVLPFLKEIAPFMAASDVIMGKVGPNVLFEAVVLDKPFVATTYFPGQEKGNLEFMERHGLGRVALKFEQQCEAIRVLSKMGKTGDGLTAKVREYREWNCAANEMVPGVVDELLRGLAR